MSNNKCYKCGGNGSYFTQSEGDMEVVRCKVCNGSGQANTEPTRELAQIDPNSYEWLDDILANDIGILYDNDGIAQFKIDTAKAAIIAKLEHITEQTLEDCADHTAKEVTAARIDERQLANKDLELYRSKPLNPGDIQRRHKSEVNTALNLVKSLNNDRIKALKNQQGGSNK